MERARHLGTRVHCRLFMPAGVFDLDHGSEATLTLYVNGDSTLSRRAVVNIRRIIADHLDDACLLEVVDVTRSPDRAEAARILATPTLVRLLPKPERRVTGDLADADRVLVALELNDDSPGR